MVFPWVGLSGKVVGFTARVLDQRTKGVEKKYVNSPDSEIYHKASLLYGIYQAKKSIAKLDRVYLVEGQADVISMYQAGIENVVAGSGTALSFAQIHMLHRLTSNITLIYDDDEAGLHAALKGTDMLLSEGMNLKVLLLPDGEDPDSFARKHTAEDLKLYIQQHEIDFIQFKTDLLLKNVTDPVKRTEAINSIVKSISLVMNPILRDTYVQTCVQRTGVAEATLINTMNRFIREQKENKNNEARREQETPQIVAPTNVMAAPASTVSLQEKVERMLVQMIVRNGSKVVFRNIPVADGSTIDLSVAQYIYYDLQADHLQLSIPLYARILDEAFRHSADEGFDSLQYFVHHADIDICKVAAELSVDQLQFIKDTEPEPPLNEEEAKERQAEAEARQAEAEERLRIDTVHLLLDFRMDYAERRLQQLGDEIKAATDDPVRMTNLIREYSDMQKVRNVYAQKLGNRIIR